MAIPVAITFVLFVKHRPSIFIKTMMLRFANINVVFIILISVSVALSLSLIAQERGLRKASAKAASKFDLVVTAPGSKISALMSSVYLQKSTMPLLSARHYNRVANHPMVEMAAPLAFGDGNKGEVIVGTTADFVVHMSDGNVKGYVFEGERQAVIGYSSTLSIGDVFTPEHAGLGDSQSRSSHKGYRYTVVGEMSYTGTPWDKAILVPIEDVWSVHGLQKAEIVKNHSHDERKQGSEYKKTSVEEFFGAQAIVVKARKLMANYALKKEFTTFDTMAIFPGAVLSQLHSVVGDLQKLISILGIATQLLVVLSVMTSFVILNRLFSKHMAMLSAVGAPRRYIYGVIWGYAVSLTALGAVFGALIA